MTENNLEELIEKISRYIVENAEKNPLLGLERDHCLIMAQDIGNRIYQEVLAKWKEKTNGEKTNGKEKEKEAV